MKLNLFLPAAQQNERPPARLASTMRRAVGWLGPGWRAAPLRRVAQLLTLGLFLILLFHLAWPLDSSGSTRLLEGRETIGVERFLQMDPLASLASALSARTWTVALAIGVVVMLAGLIMPRVFCSHICPLGTMIDLFDASLGRWTRRHHLRQGQWWTHLRYAILASVAVGAVVGLSLAGLVAAMPLVTRGLVYAVGPVQLGLLHGWESVPPMTASQWAAAALMLGVLLLGLLGRRFWCRCLCPTGALMGLAASWLRISDRKVSSSCINCDKCRRTCSFGAINNDYSTRPAACTFCQDCGGVCPVGAIAFVGRWDNADQKQLREPVAANNTRADLQLSRRSMLAGTAAGIAAVALRGVPVLGWRIGQSGDIHLVRPPGSLPESEFLALCVRCGNCVQACPSKVLRPIGASAGLESAWTPQAVANWAGCRQDCNNCGQACPTGAIRNLPLEEKRAARMGRAVVDEATCLPASGRQECGLCVTRCAQAGYDAIEFRQVHVELDEYDMPVEGTGFQAPLVLPEKCVGCGQCQAICHQVNRRELRLLKASAIVVQAGPGNEDRLSHGSYLALRQAEQQAREAERQNIDVSYPLDIPDLPD